MSDEYGYLRELRDSAIRGLARGEEKEARNRGPRDTLYVHPNVLFLSVYTIFNSQRTDSVTIFVVVISV